MCTTHTSYTPKLLLVFRYLLLEWKFSSFDIGYKVLKGEDSKYLLGFFKKQIQAYHGDYGVACVQHSLTGKYCIALLEMTEKLS